MDIRMPGLDGLAATHEIAVARELAAVGHDRAQLVVLAYETGLVRPRWAD